MEKLWEHIMKKNYKTQINVPTNLRKLKSKVDKLDVDKLLPVSVSLSKLSDVVKNDVVKKDVYNAKIKKHLRWNTWYY